MEQQPVQFLQQVLRASKVYTGLGNTTWNCNSVWGGSNIRAQHLLAGTVAAAVLFIFRVQQSNPMQNVDDYETEPFNVDEGQYPVIHAGNIGNQCVCYAKNAGNAKHLKWEHSQ